MGPDPAVAAVRSAVRNSLADLDPGAVVLVACSGGTDSVALAAAAAFETTKAGWTAAGLTVDHGLQPGSADRATKVAAMLAELGLEPVELARVCVGGSGGPEAAARRARYAGIDEVAGRLGAATVLLGHTRDDQAETVLLGLARGSGARSLAGMQGEVGTGGVRYRRPFLGLDRSVTRAACAAEGHEVWDDPHNADPVYTRSRVRHRVLPVLERELGPGIAAALARTADLLRDDADALDAWADRAWAECTATEPDVPGSTGLWVNRLQAVPPAVRRRVLRRGALWAGSPGTDLTAGHVATLESLVVDWRGQAWVDLPGGVRASRRGGQICLARAERNGS